MSNKVKDIDTKKKQKKRTFYFFDNIINIKNIDLNNIKIDEKSYKNIPIYYIGYMTTKDSKYVKIKCKSFTPYIRQSEWILKKLIKISISSQLLLVRAKKKVKNMKKCGVKPEI